MVSEKSSFKNSKFYKECMTPKLFCHQAISQFLMADISFSIAWKELKIAQNAQGNVLFQLLNLVATNGHGFYELSRIANDEKCKQ